MDDTPIDEGPLTKDQKEVLENLEKQMRNGVIETTPKPKTIPINSYLVLQGLFIMATRHIEALDEITRECEKIVGEKHRPNSRTADFVWGGATKVDALLNDMNIKVAHRNETWMIF